MRESRNGRGNAHTFSPCSRGKDAGRVAPAREPRCSSSVSGLLAETLERSAREGDAEARGDDGLADVEALLDETPATCERVASGQCCRSTPSGIRERTHEKRPKKVMKSERRVMARWTMLTCAGGRTSVAAHPGAPLERREGSAPLSRH